MKKSVKSKNIKKPKFLAKYRSSNAKLFNKTHRISFAVLVVSLVVLLLAALGLPMSQAYASVAADDGAHMVSEKWIDARTVDISIASPSIDTRTKSVRLLLPLGWTKTTTKSWPTLWLLHGGYGSYVDWTKQTDVAQLSANHNVIMVMPDTAGCSSYTNWWNYGKYGVPAWDTFITTEVRQILERGYHANTTRAIAGPSMGGLGALKLAASHPSMFAAAASFSGNVDPLHSYDNTADGPDKPAYLCFMDWKRVWGDYTIPAQKLIWQQNDPYNQASQFAGLKYLYISNGDGVSDPLHAGGLPDVFEQPFNKQSQALASKLQGLGIPVTTHFYPGTHTWPYWQRELHSSFPAILQALNTQ